MTATNGAMTALALAGLAGKRLFLFGGYRNLARGDCRGITPCDMAGPTTEVTPGGMVYGL